MHTSDYGCIEITRNVMTEPSHSLSCAIAKSIFDKISSIYDSNMNSSSANSCFRALFSLLVRNVSVILIYPGNELIEV